MSIISSNTKVTNQRLDQLSERIDKNAKKLIDIETENKEITKGVDVFEDNIDDKINELNKKKSKLKKNIKQANEEIGKRIKNEKFITQSRRSKLEK